MSIRDKRLAPSLFHTRFSPEVLIDAQFVILGCEFLLQLELRLGWRLPAPEIERGVAAAAATMLRDEPAIADAALASGLAEHQLPCLLALAKDLDRSSATSYRS